VVMFAAWEVTQAGLDQLGHLFRMRRDDLRDHRASPGATERSSACR